MVNLLLHLLTYPIRWWADRGIRREQREMERRREYERYQRGER